jgi:two-component system OmpR family sensor kinase
MSRDRTAHVSSRVPGLRALRPFQRLVRGRLRLRVLIAVVSLTLVTLAAFDVTAVTALRSYLMNQTDTALRNAALVIRPELTGLPPGGDVSKPQPDPTVVKQPPGAAAPGHPPPPGVQRVGLNKPGSEVANELGTWVSTHQFIVGLYSVLFIPNTGIPLAVEDGTAPSEKDREPNVPMNLRDLVANGQAQNNVSFLGDPLRSVAVRTANGTVVISTSLDDVNSTVARMWLIVLIGSAAVVLFLGLGVFCLLRRGLRPIETMAAQADRITAGDLTDRVTPQDPRSEVGRLGSALNGMLARIEASVHEREADQELMRRFFADASHELRTPLASMRANAELYQQGALPERAQVDEVVRRIGLEALRMSGLVDDMLRLARLDQHPDQQREPVDVGELVAGCVDRIRVAAPQRDWHTEIAIEVITVGDEELLRRAVDNLLTNVFTHTPPGTVAMVALRERDGTVEIEVSDTGPGVPPDRLPRIFDRFYRAGTIAPRPGSGLGLAIVHQIATVHNGIVVAEPNSPHGLRVRLTLPVAGPLGLTQDSHDSPAEV